MSYENIPYELKALNQWIIWRLETTDTGRPTKVPYSPITGRMASVTNPADWGSWLQANQALALSGYTGLGFVFTASDPYTGIDLDETTDPGRIALQSETYKRFRGSYSELSHSGKGLHFIVRGQLPTGKRRGAIEVYSSERYFAMTGNVHENAPIADKQAELQWLWQELGGNETVVSTMDVGTTVDRETDEVIYNRAINALNGDKFAALWNGQWSELGYPSQSEADFALIDILAFYTQSIPQIKRLFRYSALGKREKAQSDKPRVNGKSYVDHQIMRAFDRQLPPVDISGLKAQIDQVVDARVEKEEATYRPPNNAHVPPAISGENPYLRNVPGMLGWIAHFIYQASPRPVPEIALAGAIGLMAGITGRAWNVSGAGLNHYVMLLADTGTGKEAIHTGIRRLMSAVADIGPGGGGCPGALEFLGPDDIASGQALVKHFKSAKSFITVQGEFDLTLKNFVSKHANAAMVKLKQIVLKSYSRSGRGQVLEGTIYSEAEKNVAPVGSPAMSLIGEGTPERFYNLLDEALVADGLLPRFTIIHYTGARVPLHKTHREVDPPEPLIRALAGLCGQSLMLNQAGQVIDVAFTAEAQRMADAYDRHIDRVMNSTKADVYKQLWNRAHLKAMKLAALIAVGTQSVTPVIDESAMQYAIDIVNYDTTRLVAKFESGDVGESESRQVSDFRRQIKRYYQYAMNANDAAHKVGATPLMLEDRVIPWRYMLNRVGQIASYKSDRMGATFALKRVVAQLEESGVIQQLGPIDAAKYGAARGAKLYAIVDPNWLTLGSDED